MKSTIKTRFFCWLAIILLLLVGLFRLCYFGAYLNTNVMDLLPQSQHGKVVDKALNLFYSNMGKQIIFLIGNPNKIVAQNSADLFFQHITQGQFLQNIFYRLDSSEQQAWGSFYFPYRLSLLTPAHKELLIQNKVKQIQQAAIFDLYSPMGVASAALLQNDPVFLFQHYLMSLPKPANNVELHEQRMMVYDKQDWYVMLNAMLKEDSFSLANQNKVVSLLETIKDKVLTNFPDTQVLMSGMLFYAKAGADDAQHDISIIGLGSLVGIVLLCLFTFRSLLPLVYILMSALIGFIAAFVVTQYIFGTVYVFTMVLGASLIGICVDYAFFYYADQLLGGAKWNAIQGLKNIFPGISLGLLNVVIAYIILSFTPFSALKQLALFAIIGLTMAYATVICVFPLILKAKTYANTPLLLHCGNKYLELVRKLTARQIAIIYLIIVVFSAGGMYRLHSNDDIRILQSMPTYLTQAENKIKQIIGSDLGIKFYVIMGNTPSQTLEHEYMLTQMIDQSFPEIAHRYLAINSYVPTIQEQKENFQLNKTMLKNDDFIKYLQQIGVKQSDAKEIQQKLTKIKFRPLTIDAWLQSPISKAMRFLWLGKIDDQFVSIVLLSDHLNSTKLRNLPYIATYIDRADEISQIFKIYRIKMSVLLLIVYGVLFVLLLIRYSLGKALRYFLPPVAACILSLGTLGWLGLPLTLFNVLGLILISGIAVDYVLFFAETKSSYQATMLATFLSAIATILSFGLLFFSSTPVIHYFGITVLVGIISALLLAPLII